MNYWNFLNFCSKIKLNFFFKDSLLTWFERHNFWIFFYSGFFFDECFSLFFKSILSNFLILPSFFIFDKWFSFWTGFGLVKFYLKFLNNFFFYEKIDFFFLLFFLITSIFVAFFFIYMIIFFLI